MPKSYYLDDSFLSAALRQVPYASPLAVYLALFTTAPTQAGGGVEVTGGAYARQTVTFGVPVDGVSTNTVDVLFPIATAGWGTLVAFGVYDASSGGNLLYYSMLSSPRAVVITDQPRFAAGQLAATEA